MAILLALIRAVANGGYDASWQLVPTVGVADKLKSAVSMALDYEMGQLRSYYSL